jgi:hypothetical protein
MNTSIQIQEIRFGCFALSLESSYSMNRYHIIRDCRVNKLIIC